MSVHQCQEYKCCFQLLTLSRSVQGFHAELCRLAIPQSCLQLSRKNQLAGNSVSPRLPSTMEEKKKGGTGWEKTWNKEEFQGLMAPRSRPVLPSFHIIRSQWQFTSASCWGRSNNLYLISNLLDSNTVTAIHLLSLSKDETACVLNGLMTKSSRNAESELLI